MVLWSDSKNVEKIHPEIYMISDEGQELFAEDLIEESSERGMIKVKGNGLEAQFLKDRKAVDQVEVDYFLVNVAHGESKHGNLSYLNDLLFPICNRPLV